MAHVITFSQGCISTTVTSVANVDLKKLIEQNSSSSSLIDYLIYNGVKLFPYSHRDGKNKCGLIYYVSSNLGYPKSSFVVVAKKCKDREVFAKSTSIHPFCKEFLVENIVWNDTIFMRFYPNSLSCKSFPKQSDVLRKKVILFAIDILECYSEYHINLKLSHIFISGSNLKLGDVDCDMFTETFYSKSKLWPIMVIILNTYFYPVELLSDQKPKDDDIIDIVKGIRPKITKFLKIALDIINKEITTLSHLKDMVRKC